MDSIKDLYFLSEALGSKLKAKNLSLAVAESCTGGLLAECITRVPGSSQWFDSGIISYSNHSKSEYLHIPKALITEKGAVSTEVAQAMAEAILKLSAAQIGFSITGIAGPEGGSPHKPVGLVYFALSSLSEATLVREQRFKGTRSQIREQSVCFALQWLLSKLEP